MIKTGSFIFLHKSRSFQRPLEDGMLLYTTKYCLYQIKRRLEKIVR